MAAKKNVKRKINYGNLLLVAGVPLVLILLIFNHLRPHVKLHGAETMTVEFGGTEQQVILFNPKSFDEAGDLVQHLSQGRSIVMTLEGVPTDLARRLLDFLSGIAYALQGKITPISAKTYFVTPQNVDVLGAEEFGSSGSGTAST